ncbi:DAHL domain-containing protein [Pseudomonas gingeri]|uniref:histidine kinase n=1 Tax=Pseudomonas gingeri TaxID=117681 RepID=A0A7Y7YIZ1_9PSED|nr:DAHL domain-containing protein [Pseudomonas gingeri]NWA04857.1 GHKL domain-containing protein [Pseudomonas gingeri]NWA17738.1 GHKL domain-containing protein [Pseudomonas gingeri]NWA56854.1 GHKL domain-containing protein [Pseudomonas gingeri]NWA97280.1 GHKL domain-containing protein [Pseudomonas gingeri]NWB01668.1 GHKL domain-containing protein [Pseudomonas gingeri]
MTRWNRYRSSALVALFIILVSLLAFLLVKVYSRDTSTYFESRDLLRQLKQLDGKLDAKVLKARISAEYNYNLLAGSTAESSRRWEQLVALNTRLDGSPIWQARKKAYLDATAEKNKQIEQFQVQNITLRDDLETLSSLEETLQKDLEPFSVEHPVATLTVLYSASKLTLSTLEYAQHASNEKAERIQRQIDNLTTPKSALAATLTPSLDKLVEQVNLIVREQPLANDLLDRIGFIPVAANLDAINEYLNESQRRADLQSHQDYIYLTLCAACMALLVFYLIIRQLRSHALINQMNSALQAANERLEQRVEERTRELREAQSELLDTARMAGMAEIATNVLHNVGNVLNSVNISADLVSRKVRTSKAQGLGKAVQLMSEHADDLGHFISQDEKGKLLPAYLGQLVTAIGTEQTEIVEELAQLSKSVDHIKEIVATQQSYAGAARLLEPLNITDLLEDALRMNSGALTRHQVTVLKDYQDVPTLLGDKHRLLLVLINLISNAKYAVSDLSNRERDITLGVRVVDGTTLRISVKDDGEGIAPENISRIFNHGFTTRKDGHGFGLHSCALAAVEMNGRLYAHSDGPGKGALFTLEIPLTLYRKEEHPAVDATSSSNA